MLKRPIAITLVLSLFSLLCACESQTQVEYSLEEFESEVSININDEDFKFNLIYYSPEQIEIVFTEPEEVAQMKVSIIEGEEVITLGEIAINLSDVEALTSSENFICVLYESLVSFAQVTQLINETGKMSCKGETDFGEYNITFDCDLMKITSISIDDYFYIFSN